MSIPLVSASNEMIAKRGLRKSDLDPTKPENWQTAKHTVDALGKERISEALLFAAQGDEKSKPFALYARLHDPAFASMAVQQQMRDSGLTILDILAMVRNMDVAIGLAESGKHIAGILDDMGVESRASMIPCEQCAGAERAAEELRAKGIDVGELPECVFCGGSGAMLKPGSAEARKLFLEVHGLRKQGGQSSGAVNVAVQVNSTQPNAPEPVTSRVQRILDAAPSATREVKEAEIVPDKESA